MSFNHSIQGGSSRRCGFQGDVVSVTECFEGFVGVEFALIKADAVNGECGVISGE